LKVEATPGGLHEIALRSRHTPRVANTLLQRVTDFAIVRRQSLDAPFLKEIFGKLGIDENGLEVSDRKYLKVLARQFAGGPVGVQTLALALDEATETLLTTREPFLCKKGFIVKTSQGRELTKKGYLFLQKLKEKANGHQATISLVTDRGEGSTFGTSETKTSF
jgi:Holliday junction DNA helicase RuvB